MAGDGASTRLGPATVSREARRSGRDSACRPSSGHCPPVPRPRGILPPTSLPPPSSDGRPTGARAWHRRGSTVHEPALAAVAAVVAALVRISVTPYLGSGDAQPHLSSCWRSSGRRRRFEAVSSGHSSGACSSNALGQRPLGSTTLRAADRRGPGRRHRAVFDRVRSDRRRSSPSSLSLLFRDVLLSSSARSGTPVPIDDPIASWVPGAILDILAASRAARGLVQERCA